MDVPPRDDKTRPERWAVALLLSLLVACAGAPAPAPALDVFHDLYLRGPPARSGEASRVALTFDGLGPCAAELLAELGRSEGGARLTATFFVTPQALATAEPALLSRVALDGHELALAVSAERWPAEADELRRLLLSESEAWHAHLSTHGAAALGGQRFWRPLASQMDLALLGQAASVDRPLVLWSVYIDEAEDEALAARVSARLQDGAILRLAPGCGASAQLKQLRPLLAQAGLRTVTAKALLGAPLAAQEALRVIRFTGEPLPMPCAQALDLPSPAEPPGPRLRFGVVEGQDAAGRLRILPLPSSMETTAELLAHQTELLRLWARRERLAGMPACLQTVASHQVASPLTLRRGQALIKVWVVGPEGLAGRDPRALSAPNRPVMLPSLPDLVRLEARQRLPWRLRGVVGGALARLGLEIPLLLEARATVGVVIARPLAATASLEQVREALGGYVQLVEVSLGEYLWVAADQPSAASALARAAHASDGFLRAGPFLALARPGGAPDWSRVGIDGRAAFDAPPEWLVARVLASGQPLAPGDVVAASPPGASEGLAAPREDADLARALLLGLREPRYLRPGGVVKMDGDLLGQQLVRLAVPPGLAVPALETTPLVEHAQAKDKPDP